MTVTFVGGSPRSGTTLLQSVLCTDATTNPLIEECSYLRHLVAGYAFGRDVFPYQTRDYFADAGALRDLAADSLSRLLGGLRERYACRDLVLKEPLLTPLMPDLKELLPEARFVVALRDPRDAIASMVRVQERHLAEGRASDLAALGRDAGALAGYWRSFYEPVVTSECDDFVRDVLLVRHEDLVAHPERIAGALRSFTGLALADFDPGRPWARSAIDFESSYKKNHSWSSPLYGKGLSSSRTGAWRETLTENEAVTVETECGDLIEAFGYAIDSLSTTSTRHP